MSNNNNNNTTTTSRPPPIATGAARPGHIRMKENEDLRAVRRAGDILTLHAIRTERYERFGELVRQFERDAERSRGLNRWTAVQKASREREFRRIDALPTESVKDVADRDRMSQANVGMEAKYGEVSRQGALEQQKLAKYKAYLAAEHDEEPELEES